MSVQKKLAVHHRNLLEVIVSTVQLECATQMRICTKFFRIIRSRATRVKTQVYKLLRSSDNLQGNGQKKNLNFHSHSAN